ncbi:MAG: glycosyltransferase family 9 protein [Aeromonadales bacterium]|nr:glycosyltransferase family 9 protein [Aeromonadales bacterium]MDY2890256.1 glycosyltransferase family 9 protein [Succinivibrio sp.]
MRHRKAKLKKFDIKNKKEKHLPNNISKVLLIDSSGMFGDSLYIAGLANALNKEKINIAIATPECYKKLYKGHDFIELIIDLESDEATNQLKTFNPDVAVDLTYAKNYNFPARAKILSGLSCYCIATADYLDQLNIYDKIITYRDCNHISERMKKIYKFITGKQPASKIKPFVSISEKNLDKAEIIKKDLGINEANKLIYLNTKARSLNRDLSLEQVCVIIDQIIKTEFTLIVYSKNEFKSYLIKKYTSNIKILPEISFSAVCAIISKANAVITPDTSITHVASCFNIPTLTFFRGNCLDYYKCHFMKDIWSSISDIHVNCYINSPKFKVDKYGYTNFKETPISKIPTDKLLKQVKCFLTEL